MSREIDPLLDNTQIEYSWHFGHEILHVFFIALDVQRWGLWRLLPFLRAIIGGNCAPQNEHWEK